MNLFCHICGTIMRFCTHYISCLLLLFCCANTHAQQPGGIPPDTYYNIPVLKEGENPADKLGADIFIRVVTSKNTVYTGEPLLVEYKLYRAITTDPSPGKEPAFNGCSVVELSPQNEPFMEVVNGKRYHIIVLRKVQLTPLQEGPLVLAEASINNIIQYSTADNPSLVKTFSLTAASKPVTVAVKDLPEKDKPADFSGLVGDFTISAKLDSNTIPAGDNSHLTITIKGTGNIGQVTMPVVNWPENTEHFESSDTQHTSQDAFPQSGDKIFDIPFIGKQQGSAVIPPVSFSYFNPVAEKYITAHSDSLRIQFTGPLPKEQQKEIVTGDITNRKYLWIVPAIALTVAFVLIISSKNQRKERKRQQAKKVLEYEEIVQPAPPAPVVKVIHFDEALAALAEIDNDHVFFNKARELLTAALQKKLGLATTQEAELINGLQQSRNKAITEKIAQLYRVCNQSLYSPIIHEEQRAEVNEGLGEVIRALEV